MPQEHTIAIIGNPNCGKTTLFNALTGARQRVGNWPGVTVERKSGCCTFEGRKWEVVDLPGTYSLDVPDQEISLDEKIARDYIHGGEADLIVNILDASNLERNLYLTSQLIEMGAPLVISLNMNDVAGDRGMAIDADTLADRLGCPVVPCVASSGDGVPELRRAVRDALDEPPRPKARVPHHDSLKRAVRRLVPLLSEAAERHGTDPVWLAMRLLEGDDLALEIAGVAVGRRRLEEIRAGVGGDVDILLADARYGFANDLAREAVRREARSGPSPSDRIDRVVLSRVLGIPIFLAVMYLMFMFTINLGGALIDFFDILTGTLVVDGSARALGAMGSPDWLTVLLSGGIGGGIRTVATFIPVIAFMYLFLSALEDSGYMARAAFVMDRFMRFIGLPGKAFVPLIVGFGCNVPAIMATRTLEHRRDRILTVMMAPFMSCGARLPVYALFAAAFFPSSGQNVVFGLYLIGILMAVLSGLAMKHTLLRGEAAPFVMELPPYHMPTPRGVLLRTWDRTKSFVVKAGMVIVPMVLVLNFLNALGTDGSFGNEDSDRSVLSEVGRTISPAFSPMGLDRENWPAAVGIFTGVLAKEAVVGTLDSIYGSLAETGSAGPAGEEGYRPWAGVKEAFATIPANLSEGLGTWADPLGLGIGEVATVETAAREQEVTAGTFGAMAARFDGAAGAFAYLLFILLYFPCVAVIAAVYRETSPGWAVFVAAWTSGLAWISATIFYQAATFARHPAASMAWIAGLTAVLLVSILAMRWYAVRPLTAVPLQEPAT